MTLTVSKSTEIHIFYVAFLSMMLLLPELPSPYLPVKLLILQEPTQKASRFGPQGQVLDIFSSLSILSGLYKQL